MIRFQCECGAPLYFESTACLACKSKVGFDPVHYRFKRLNQEAKTQGPKSDRLCANGLNHGVCNWIAKTNFPGALCFACQFNRFIPNLNKPRNLSKSLEIARNLSKSLGISRNLSESLGISRNLSESIFTTKIKDFLFSKSLGRIRFDIYLEALLQTNSRGRFNGGMDGGKGATQFVA